MEAKPPGTPPSSSARTSPRQVNGGSTEHGYNTTISATDDLAAKKAADQINAAIQSAYDLNAHDEMTGSTLLIWAAQLGISESVTKLLEHGADPNLGSQDHAITPLMTAARHHNLNTLELLLPLSAIDQCDSKGATALSVCAECGNHLGITMLTEAEADINKPDKNGFTPLFVAVQHGKLKCAETILSNPLCQINQAMTWAVCPGATPIFAAAKKGRYTLLELLLKHKARLNKTDEAGTTPLSAAAHEGHTMCVELLMKQAAEINLADANGYTPLYVAAQNGHLSCVKLLLGVVRVTSTSGHPINYARINTSMNQGATPFWAAASKGREEVCRLLQEQGADINKATNDGTTAISAAAYDGHEKMLEYLIPQYPPALMLQRDTKGGSPLLYAARNGHSHCCRVLLAKGANVQQEDKIGNSPVFVASQHGHDDCVALLCRYRADVNKKNRDGLAPALVATTGNFPKCLVALAKYGADFDVYSASGESAVSIATRNSYAHCLNLLVDHDCDLSMFLRGLMCPQHPIDEAGRNVEEARSQIFNGLVGKTKKGNS